MRIGVTVAVAAACFVLPSTVLWAASLQVAPVSIEVQAPAAAATLRLRNEGTSPLNAQIRVFRWSQVNGQERLEPTDDVVASPPMASLAASTDYVVRLVRLTKRPLAVGESYRLLVDELPDASAPRDRVVTLVVRYSIPVFFYPSGAAEANVTWSVERQRGRLYVSASNTGDRHVRIADLKLGEPGGQFLSFGNGLTGYVLGRSTMRWAAPAKAQRLPGSSAVVISALGDKGPIHASPSMSSAR